MRAATVRCTLHRPLENAAAGNSTSGGPSPGMFDAALRTDSAGVSAASAALGGQKSVAAAGDDKSSRRRVVGVVGASASVQPSSRLHANAVQCSRIAASEWRLLRATCAGVCDNTVNSGKRTKATNASS